MLKVIGSADGPEVEAGSWLLLAIAAAKRLDAGSLHLLVVTLLKELPAESLHDLKLYEIGRIQRGQPTHAATPVLSDPDFAPAEVA